MLSDGVLGDIPVEYIHLFFIAFVRLSVLANMLKYTQWIAAWYFWKDFTIRRHELYVQMSTFY